MMVVTLKVPEYIVSLASKLGVDIEKEFLEYIIRRLNLDPASEMRVHLDLARRFLEEGKKLVNEDPIQASEKLYKSVEEAIKALALHYNINQIISRVRAQGRWTITDLEKAVKILKKEMGDIVMDAWDHAWYLHVMGFHEAKLDSESVSERIAPIEKLIRKTSEMISKDENECQ